MKISGITCECDGVIYPRSELICTARSHLNSVNKELSEGNYVINGYHGCAIYSVNGTDGSIIWRLGGFKSDFPILDGYELRHMHHVRLRSLESTKLPASVRSQISSQTHIALSIFDNGFNGIMAPTASSSSAIVLLLDLLARTAQVVERYTPPFDSPVQYAALFGAVNFQSNGNRCSTQNGIQVAIYPVAIVLTKDHGLADLRLIRMSSVILGPASGTPQFTLVGTGLLKW